MNISETTENGLYYRTWATDSKPKGAVQLMHGLGEHCARYDAIALALTDHGYSVHSMDLPGHGKSEGTRGHVDSFDVFQRAALSLYDKISQESPDTPVYLLGHSMGGLIAARFLFDHQAKFNGAILSAPAIQSPQQPPAWQVAVITLIAKLFPTAGMLALDASGVSRDPAVLERYMSDPLVNKGKLSAKFLLELTNTMQECKSGAEQITLPLLVMHGTADIVTAPSGSEYLIDSVKSQDKELKLYSGLYHEIFNEPEAPAIYQELIDWLQQH